MASQTDGTTVDGTTVDGDDAGGSAADGNGELLRRATNGDWAAWRALVGRFGRLVHRVSRGAGLGPADAADAAQLTWLRLWQHGHQIREPEKLPGWLCATARRESGRIAAHTRRYVLCADPGADTGAERRGVLDDVDAIEGDYEPHIEKALSRLPAHYERLLRLLTSSECLSYLEIAQRINVPVGSIGPMRMRAIRMLRQAPELAGAAPVRRGGARRQPAPPATVAS